MDNKKNIAILQTWVDRDFVLEESLLEAPGEIIQIAGNPYYIPHTKEGDLGNKPMIVSRYCMAKRIGRPLQRHEILKFKTPNKKDFRLENFTLYSKTASASEMYAANGMALGWSHCLCGCGGQLDIALQKTQPHAFLEGHRSLTHMEKKIRRAEKPKNLLSTWEESPMPQSKEAPDPLLEYRALFEKMIHNLPWQDFERLLQVLLEISSTKKEAL